MTPRAGYRDRRCWYGIGAVAVLLVLLLLAWAAGWFGGAPRAATRTSRFATLAA